MIPDMVLRQSRRLFQSPPLFQAFLHKIQALFSRRPEHTLAVLFDDTAFFLPDRQEMVPAGDSIEATLADILDTCPTVRNLEIHYQGRAACFLVISGKTVTGYLAQRLPPGKKLEDYAIALCNRTAGLLPRESLAPFFRFAESRNLGRCQVQAFPGSHNGRFRFHLRGADWVVDQKEREISSLIPLPDGGYLPETWQVPTETIDYSCRLFEEPLFTWRDPAEQKRLARFFVRRLLWSALFLGFLIPCLAGGFLWLAMGHYEQRLAALAPDHQRVLESLKERDELTAQIQAGLTAIAKLRSHHGDYPGRAVFIRNILNQMAEDLKLDVLRLTGEPGGGSVIILEGSAPDPDGVAALESTLAQAFPNFLVIPVALIQAEPEYESKERPAGYRFKISMEPKP